MTAASQPRATRGRSAAATISLGAPPTAAERLQALERPVQEAKV
jgi:hypothetical protein